MLTWTDERLAELPVKDDVRLRGLDMTRLETFCDAAFAFAVTLMVIAGGNLPDSFAALVEALKDVPAFLASFAYMSLPIVMPILAKREAQGANRLRATMNRSSEASHC